MRDTVNVASAAIPSGWPDREAAWQNERCRLYPRRRRRRRAV